MKRRKRNGLICFLAMTAGSITVDASDQLVKIPATAILQGEIIAIHEIVSPSTPREMPFRLNVRPTKSFSFIDGVKKVVVSGLVQRELSNGCAEAIVHEVSFQIDDGAIRHVKSSSGLGYVVNNLGLVCLQRELVTEDAEELAGDLGLVSEDEIEAVLITPAQTVAILFTKWITVH